MTDGTKPNIDRFAELKAKKSTAGYISIVVTVSSLLRSNGTKSTAVDCPRGTGAMNAVSNISRTTHKEYEAKSLEPVTAVTRSRIDESAVDSGGIVP